MKNFTIKELLILTALIAGGLAVFVSLRDMLSGRETVEDIILSQDGSTLAATFGDGTVRVWNTASGENIFTTTESNDIRNHIAPALSKNGDRLILHGYSLLLFAFSAPPREPNS